MVELETELDKIWGVGRLKSFCLQKYDEELEWEWIPENEFIAIGGVSDTVFYRPTQTYRKNVILKPHQVRSFKKTTTIYKLIIYLLQIGKMRLPACLQPKASTKRSLEDKTLGRRLRARVKQLAKLLATFQESNDSMYADNSLFRHWNNRNAEIPTNESHLNAAKWRESLPLPFDPHLDNILLSSILLLFKQDLLAKIETQERTQLVWGLGAVCLYLIAVSIDLNSDEPATLDGSLSLLFDNLRTGVIQYSHSTSSSAFQLMWHSIDITTFQNMSEEQLFTYRVEFAEEHGVYELSTNAPSYQHPSQTSPQATETNISHVSSHNTSKKRKIKEGAASLKRPRISTRKSRNK